MLPQREQSIRLKLENTLSQLSYSNIKLAQSLSERDFLVYALHESEKREQARSNELAAVLDAVPVAVYIAHDPQVLQITGNHLSYAWLRLPAGIEVNDCELDIVSADGEIRHVLGNARPLRDEQGNLRGSISAFKISRSVKKQKKNFVKVRKSTATSWRQPTKVYS